MNSNAQPQGTNNTSNPQDIPKPSLLPQTNELQGATNSSRDTSKIPIKGSSLSVVQIPDDNSTKTEITKNSSGDFGLVWFLIAFALIAGVVWLVRARRRGIW